MQIKFMKRLRVYLTNNLYYACSVIKYDNSNEVEVKARVRLESFVVIWEKGKSIVRPP